MCGCVGMGVCVGVHMCVCGCACVCVYVHMGMCGCDVRVWRACLHVCACTFVMCRCVCGCVEGGKRTHVKFHIQNPITMAPDNRPLCNHPKTTGPATSARIANAMPAQFLHNVHFIIFALGILSPSAKYFLSPNMMASKSLFMALYKAKK